MKKATHNYTGYGWEGENYNRDLTTTDIAKLIRQNLKKKFPKCKFSVTKQSFSGGSSIKVNLMSAPFTPIEARRVPDYTQAYDAYDLKPVDEQYAQLNEHSFHDWRGNEVEGQDYHFSNGHKLSPEAWELLKSVCELVSSFRFDDSDSMIDYFHTNFYFHLSIGKWDREFQKSK